jgi:hypothetical protein
MALLKRGQSLKANRGIGSLKVFFGSFPVWVAVVSFRSAKVLTYRKSSDLEFGDLGTTLALLIKRVAPAIA